ncbi:MAG TPA: hypothetical protein VFD26_02255 [Methyloceanibacter sp.]|nr:hypothetical protein [Methyloceanibacter sp.]
MSRHLFNVSASPFVLALVISCAAAPAAFAQGLADDGFDPAAIEEMTASNRQVPLTKDMVDRLVASFPDMRKRGGEFPGTELPEKQYAPGSDKSELDAMPAEKRAALEAVATKHGFKDLEEWTDVANSVVMSYVYAAQNKKPGSVEEAVRMNVAQAEQDPNLTPEQRTQTVALYRKIGKTLQRLEPSKENYAIVVEMKDKVAPIMDPN